MKNLEKILAKRKIFLSLRLLAALVIMVIAILFILNTESDSNIFSAKTGDKVITLKWKLRVPNATLFISDNAGNKYTENVKGTGKYSFTEGTHGKMYTFNLEYTNNKKETTHQEKRRIFLDFKKLPNLMTLYINTQDGKDPTCEEAPKTKGLKGSTIINNDYKKAVMNDNISVRIRVRGNTTGLQKKKPYKLFFQEKIDLLDLGEEYADREWYLISQAHLKTYFGLQMGKIVGMEWEPRMRFVNLMLNGDWKGLYVLCESINRHPKRLPLKKKGFLIESDAYFWNKKGVFFGSPLFDDTIKFTFKYPKITSKFDPRALAIQKQSKIIDDAVKTRSSELANLIDFDTFAAWGIAHDIMGTGDGSGSNRYFYKYNMNPENKLKMGPLWDFDSIFRIGDNKHAAPYYSKASYYPYLMKNSSFKKYYKKKYLKVAPSIEEKMKSVMEKLKTIPGLEESKKLDAKVWGGYVSLDSEINELMGHFHERIKWLNEEIGKL